ncbi:NADP-dependent oxidoreductase domain-containing protein [Ilyonectria robusta]|uniref:NADP-dependent oxidoreductase domain-containing protein n=1 Tax=Ilyonectria robusta TaxID=1079257 RepID=UPI001E8DA50A|nr:NADP-dependent oxidoreductase domain-containing protein [Ilyonectria robusta]KAH8658967.1 NADP-dependent oxidoreductase domain-containing protein [Ilyonectria robusta]
MASTAHVNMMTDTIIANLPAEGLRAIMRSLLASHPEVTGAFERETRSYIQESALAALNSTGSVVNMNNLKETQYIIRCMVGSGLCFQSLPLLSKLVVQGMDSELNSAESESFLASVDGDIVQTMTAVQKTLFVMKGVRKLSDDENVLLETLYLALVKCQTISREANREYPYVRGLAATANVSGAPQSTDIALEPTYFQEINAVPLPVEIQETFRLKDRQLPRIFSGLWQMSSPAWGAAPTSKIVSQFSKHIQGGFTAFDMADHYGDAEVIFGRFRSSYPHKDSIFAATKYCVFHPMEVSREVIRDNVSERCQRLQQAKIDLLQFHWQFYDDKNYIDALRYLAEDERVNMVGLCNFDTKHLEEVLDSGITIHTNQIQFSLIDSRPTVQMGQVCEKHDIKLLTYGTLCGGFLAEKWLNMPEPEIYDDSITPSQRKYLGMIRNWGGWTLFQELLTVLKSIATKHGVDISNVATRWVLDFPYVGAVIVGARMGISEHTDANLASFGWSLDQQDQGEIEKILERSGRIEMFEKIGDCGGEYR